MKVNAGMIVALAVLTTTAQPLASHQCPPGTSLEEAREVVSSLALRAQGYAPGLLNLRFAFDPNASKEEKFMWQSLVLELFFANQAKRINIQLSHRKKDHYWLQSNQMDELKAVLQKAIDDNVEVAIYNMPTLGEYRLATLIS